MQVDVDPQVADVLATLLDDNAALGRAMKAGQSPGRRPVGDLQARLDALAKTLAGGEIEEQNLPTPWERQKLRMGREQQAARYARQGIPIGADLPPTLDEVRAAVQVMRNQPGMAWERALAAVRGTGR
jgi:hypothetical protein